MPRIRPRLEKFEQAGIRRLLLSMGAEVYTLGTRRPRGVRCHLCHVFIGESQGTRQTPGLPDLLAFLKRANSAPGRDLVAIECKRVGVTKLSPDQEKFREICQLAGIGHVVGTLDDVIKFLVNGEYLHATQVSAFHLEERR